MAVARPAVPVVTQLHWWMMYSSVDVRRSPVLWIRLAGAEDLVGVNVVFALESSFGSTGSLDEVDSALERVETGMVTMLVETQGATQHADLTPYVKRGRIYARTNFHKRYRPTRNPAQQVRSHHGGSNDYEDNGTIERGETLFVDSV